MDSAIPLITKFLFIESDIENLNKSDLIIVLGNDLITETGDTIKRLFDSGKISIGAKVVLSGKTGSLDANEKPECDRLFDYLTNDLQMPKNLFVKETEATNMKKNFENSKIIIEDELSGFDNFQNVLVIGKGFSLRRASMYASKCGYPTFKMQYFSADSASNSNIRKEDWFKDEVKTKRVLEELRRIGEYGAKGDLSIF